MNSIETAVYLFARVALRRMFAPIAADVTYADGTQLRVTEAQLRGTTPEGTLLEASGSRSKKSDVLATLTDEGSTRTYWRGRQHDVRDAADSADYTVDGGFRVAGVRIDPSDARLWLVGLAVSGGLLAASKWNGLFDFFVVWVCAAVVVGQRWLRRPALFGNPFGIPLDVVIGLMFVVSARSTRCATFRTSRWATIWSILSLCSTRCSTTTTISSRRIRTRRRGGSGRSSSVRFRTTTTTSDRGGPTRSGGLLRRGNSRAAQPVRVVVRADHRAGRRAAGRGSSAIAGYALLIVAYFLQWLPWIGSPRIAFEYHFFPNLAIIVLANAIVLQRLLALAFRRAVASDPRVPRSEFRRLRRGSVAALCFAFFYPVLAGSHVTWDAWHSPACGSRGRLGSCSGRSDLTRHVRTLASGTTSS